MSASLFDRASAALTAAPTRAYGIFRQAMVVKGRNRDTAWYSIADMEWPPLRARFERWLAAENFTASGDQIKTLATV